MVLGALVVTFGTASVLQVMAVQNNRPTATVVVEAAKPALKGVGGKERVLSQARDGAIRSATNLAGL